MPNFSLPDSVFESAAALFPTPFHLYDEQGIRERARRLKAAFAWCPDFREYFAVKALPNPAILSILGEEGCGLDCSSATELMLAERGGFRGDQIQAAAGGEGQPYARPGRRPQRRLIAGRNRRVIRPQQGAVQIEKQDVKPGHRRTSPLLLPS